MTLDLGNPTLLELRREAWAVAVEFEALAGDLAEEQALWSPRVGTWSIAQCLEHLTLTAEQVRPPLRAALDQARAGPRSGAPLRPSLFGRWLLSTAGRQAARRLGAPSKLAPGPRPPPGALARFLTTQRRLVGFLEEADGLDINAVQVASPIRVGLRLSLGEALALATGHTRRHLEQARRVRAHPGFPG